MYDQNMERNKKLKKFGDRTSKGDGKKKNYVHKKKLGGATALQLLCTSGLFFKFLCCDQKFC